MLAGLDACVQNEFVTSSYTYGSNLCGFLCNNILKICNIIVAFI
jgi:hypothetical protein